MGDGCLYWCRYASTGERRTAPGTREVAVTRIAQRRDRPVDVGTRARGFPALRVVRATYKGDGDGRRIREIF